MTGNITAWSHSRLVQYERCPRQFKFNNVDKVPVPASPVMERGKVLHTQVAAYIKGNLAEPPAAAVNFKWLLDAVRDFPEDSRIIEQQWGFTRDWSKCGWFGGEVYLRSIIDAGVVYDDHTAELIDWKTGKKYGENEDELKLFAATGFRRFPHLLKITTRLVYFDMIDQDFNEYSVKEVPAIMADFDKRAARLLGDSTYPARPGNHCRWCSFSKDKDGPCQFGGQG